MEASCEPLIFPESSIASAAADIICEATSEPWLVGEVGIHRKTPDPESLLLGETCRSLKSTPPLLDELWNQQCFIFIDLLWPKDRDIRPKPTKKDVFSLSFCMIQYQAFKKHAGGQDPVDYVNNIGLCSDKYWNVWRSIRVALNDLRTYTVFYRFDENDDVFWQFQSISDAAMGHSTNISNHCDHLGLNVIN